ncbi:MAG: metallophosphoesterase family protein [Myxococcota bacterium]
MATIVFVSDTHGRHEELGRLSGDVLVHCGDGTDRTQSSIDELDAWFGEQDFEHVLFVPGNHDFCTEAHWRAGLPVFENAHVLVDERVDRCGLRRRLAELSVRVHAFGHVHHSGGVETLDETTFVNASSFHRDELELRPPVTMTLDPRGDRS